MKDIIKNIRLMLGSPEDKLYEENSYLLEKIKALQPSEKEVYYNNKYPKKNVVYFRTESDGEYRIDVRQFLNPNSFQLPKITGDTDDEKAVNGLKWVIDNIKYVKDSKSSYKKNEYWAYPYQTLNHKEADCEDGSLLLYCILRSNGIKPWKLRVTAGYVDLNGKDTGHCYLTYYSEVEDKWVALDWCFYPNKTLISTRQSYKDNKTYKEIWFSFNELYSFGRDSDLRKEPVKVLLNNI
jgi:hypothetical protein